MYKISQLAETFLHESRIKLEVELLVNPRQAVKLLDTVIHVDDMTEHFFYLLSAKRWKV